MREANIKKYFLDAPPTTAPLLLSAKINAFFQLIKALSIINTLSDRPEFIEEETQRRADKTLAKEPLIER